MKSRTEVELMMMALDLRLAAREPAARRGHRLTSERLQEMAAMFEQARQWLGPIAPYEVTAANDEGQLRPTRGYRAKNPPSR